METLTTSRLSIIIRAEVIMADFPPAHPGEALREDFMKPHGLSRAALARSLGVHTGRVSDIVRGRRPVTPDIALRLGRYFGTSAESWIGMQSTYDLESARDQIGAEVEASVSPRAA
jgi:addiction module HigA family antidote